MHKNVYLLVVYLTELHYWLKTGLKRVTKNRLIKASLTKKGSFSSVDKLSQKIVQSSPEFDDDFEILIVEIPEEKILEILKAGSELLIQFDWISKIYPISGRGTSLLKSKIDSRIILGKPIFEHAYQELANEKEKASNLKGAKTLLKIFNLEHFEDEFASFNNHLEEALKLRQSHNEKISNNRSYLVNLVLYDRSKPFPNNDLGFFYDLGSILRIYEKNNPSASQTLREYNEVLEKFKNNLEYRNIESMIKELHDSEMINKLNNIIDENIIVTSIIFLSLRSDIRESNDLEGSRIFDITSSEYLNIYYKREITFSLWLIGYFFGFEMVADLYYKKINSPVLSFLTPFPEIKKLSISIESVEENGDVDVIGTQAIEHEGVESNITEGGDKELQYTQAVSKNSEITESKNIAPETLESENTQTENKELLIKEPTNIEPQPKKPEIVEADPKETEIKVESTTIKNKPRQKKSRSKQNDEPELGV